MGKIIVHIGLPKTATTALQSDFFPMLVSDSIDYLGVFQPRNKDNQKELFMEFCNAVIFGEGINELRDKLESILQENRTIIISEEMFTNSEFGIPWSVRIKNLGEVLYGLDYRLIVSVREPIEAMFSYYAELFGLECIEECNFYTAVTNSVHFEIFHYRKLTEYLLNIFDIERMLFIKFEDIIDGRVNGLLDITNNFSNLNKEIKIGNKNKRLKTKKYVYTKYTYSLLDMIKKHVAYVGKFYKKDRLNDGNLLKKVTWVLDNIILGRKRIMRPTNEEVFLIKKCLSNETNALNEYFGIKYD